MLKIQRRVTPSVQIGSVLMGAAHPIVIQSMTNTPTADVSATVAQILELAAAGSELVRITVNDFDAMAAVPEIVERLADSGCSIPLVGDFHFNGHILLTRYPKAAAALGKISFNALDSEISFRISAASLAASPRPSFLRSFS